MPVLVGTGLGVRVAVAVASNVGVLVTVGVGVRVGTTATTVALVQSVTSFSTASCPAEQALFNHSPGSVTVAETPSVVDVPAARPSTNAQATNPVSASTDPPPLALPKLRPSGRADSTCTSVEPGFSGLSFEVIRRNARAYAPYRDAADAFTTDPTADRRLRRRRRRRAGTSAQESRSSYDRCSGSKNGISSAVFARWRLNLDAKRRQRGLWPMTSRPYVPSFCVPRPKLFSSRPRGHHPIEAFGNPVLGPRK
jgi:hypothetical protein